MGRVWDDRRKINKRYIFYTECYFMFHEFVSSNVYNGKERVTVKWPHKSRQSFFTQYEDAR